MPLNIMWVIFIRPHGVFFFLSFFSLSAFLEKERLLRGEGGQKIMIISNYSLKLNHGLTVVKFG